VHLRWFRRDDHLSLTTDAGVFDPLVLDDEDLGRLVVILLAHLDADHPTLGAHSGKSPTLASPDGGRWHNP
jgi:hypothetical protein